MAFRFRRTVRIAPGLRLNFGKTGVSLSAGVRGASLTLGRRGTFSNVGIPGTGMSWRRRLDTGSDVSSAKLPRSAVPLGDGQYRVSAAISLDEHGRLLLADTGGQPLAPAVERVFRREHEPELRRWLEERCAEINGGGDAILHLHLDTPPPDRAVTFTPAPFTGPRPGEPAPREPGFLDRVFRGRRERIAAENQAAGAAYRAALARWEEARRAHEAAEEQKRRFIEVERLSDPDAMQVYLHEVLAAIRWPRETTVSFQVDDRGASALLDVDLPEIEDLPQQEAAVAGRGLKLNIHERSEARRRREYAVHVHAVGFRLIGETFAALPGVRTVTLSAYSQRPDPATAQVRDEYIYSVRVTREGWSRIDFTNLAMLDPVACLESYELRREMSAGGEFEPIEPLARGTTSVPDEAGAPAAVPANAPPAPA
ncbi:MAG: DUF4236 domain-containing protein [Candidatus Eisenbacteria bacterium]|nr:DUF4236 domain-containing protein [Candidatus Eisenbacteria bacterium]